MCAGGNGYNEVEDAQVVREGEGAFMILEDSSDSEEEEEDEDYSLEVSGRSNLVIASYIITESVVVMEKGVL